MNLFLPLTSSFNRPVRKAIFVVLVAAALSATFVGLRGYRWNNVPVPSLKPMAFVVSVGLAAATFVSEDLALIAAGEAIRHSSLSLVPALLGCFLGIWFGDLGLWLIGRLGARHVLSWRWVARWLGSEKQKEFIGWFERHSTTAIFVARFVPGLRFPTYLAAGATGRGSLHFAACSFIAAAIWTPLLIGLVMLVGDLIAAPLRAALGYAWLTFPAGILLIYAGVRLTEKLADPISRARAVASVQRLWRWEFWPAWLFYLPVGVYIAAKSIARGGLSGFARITAANPGIPDGGFVGESKRQILCALPQQYVIPHLFCPADPEANAHRRISSVRAEMERRGWTFPLIVKPDVGQRGAGVTRCDTVAELQSAIESRPMDLIVQPYHPGPYEVGVFYVRLPSQPAGQIFSITEKIFPKVVGDGRSTLAELVWRHPRYRMQADLFLTRFAEDAHRILPAGTTQTLSIAGNHCQGTLFRDGHHLQTAALEAKIDQIARTFDGFYFGRFDIRYSDPDAFARGEDLAIVELNGVTSESTNVYDPANSLLNAWLTFIRQWRWLFQIADQNIAAGHRVTSWRNLAKIAIVRTDADRT